MKLSPCFQKRPEKKVEYLGSVLRIMPGRPHGPWAAGKKRVKLEMN